MPSVNDMVKKAKAMGIKALGMDKPQPKGGLIQAAADGISGKDEKGKAIKELMKDQ